MKDEVLKSLGRLEALDREKALLIDQLHDSLLLQELHPGIFDSGTVRIRFASQYPHTEITGVAVRSDGAEFPLPVTLVAKLRRRPGRA